MTVDNCVKFSVIKSVKNTDRIHSYQFSNAFT